MAIRTVAGSQGVIDKGISFPWLTIDVSTVGGGGGVDRQTRLMVKTR